MTHLLRHAFRLVLRDPGRAVTSALGAAIAAALFACVLLFGSASGATVTQRAVAALPVDAQVVLTTTDAKAAAAAVSADPAVRSASPFGLAHFEGASLEKAGTATQTSAGVIVGIDPGYRAATGLFSISQGATAPGQAVIGRDLASNLGAIPGDTIQFAMPGGATVDLRVSGIVGLTGADLVLGPVDAAHRAAGANPPANVAVVDGATFDALAAGIPPDAVAGATQSGAAPVPSAGLSVVAPEPAVRSEVHVRYDHAQLPGDPVAARQWLDAVRRRIELAGAGAYQVVDDVSASLDTVVQDLAWGRILFIFLALPGILLALALSFLSTDAAAEATRRHAALLRARGAQQRAMWLVFVAAGAIVALGGAIVGAIAGAALGTALFGQELRAADPVGATARAVLVAVAVVTLLGTAAAAIAVREQLRGEVAMGRVQVGPPRRPLWQRLYLDVIAFGAGILAYLAMGAAGIHPVITAEGDPTVSVALTAFVAPVLIWVGGALLLLRVMTAVITRSAWVDHLLRWPLGPGGELTGSTLAARGAAASRAILVLALSVSFAASILIFNATYRQQQRVDADLSLGADMKAVPAAVAPGSSPPDASRIAGQGVVASTPILARVVSVGSEAQDLLAIDPATLPAVAPLADTFFANVSAAQAMAALAARPDAILVSAETAKDYSIVPGDRIRIRVPDATGMLRTVEFRMAGVAHEFPTAPKDAFLVANAAYVAAQTGDPRVSFVLARADGDVGRAASALASRLGSTWTVSDLTTERGRLANSITSVDLGDLVLIDLAFAVLIASLGVGLFLLAGLSERRRELAILEAIGAEPRQIAAEIAGETIVVGVAGLLAGLAIGAVVGTTFLGILAGVFDPPADLPVVPLAEMGMLVAAVVVGLAGAFAVADRGIRRLGVVAALRER